MKAEELGSILLAFKGYEVVFSKDEEGNGFGTIENKASCFGVQSVITNDEIINVIILYPFKSIDADNFSSSFIKATREVK